jgi:eukaryotic-like serine/threonine-protein kinase
MTPERWQQIKALLASTLEVDPARREAYVDAACVGDRALRDDVHRLLQAQAVAGTHFLEGAPPVAEAIAFLERGADRWIGRRVGDYRIVEGIGAGGMGTVFRAVRADERFHKQVAIKILDTPIVSGPSLDLFRHEREILAGLEHPYIARLLDAGETDDGVPYFVMEYVDGTSIHTYCATHRLTLDDRLTLFLKLCAAVHDAHQHLVIHGDLKPANILVTETADPKLLDFGIAKLVAAGSSGGIAIAWTPMTPAYASPEQVAGKPITTASDTYSLGLVLYELLTGKYAYGDGDTAADRQGSRSDKADPERPSHAVLRDGPSTTAAEMSRTLQLTPKRLSRRVRGDLESIVLKAIRHEPSERYASVAQFAEDIRRHVSGLPVTAHPDTVTYRARKFVTRHTTGVLAASLVVVSLVAGIAVSVREARVAQRRFNEVRRLANSLLFEVHDAIRQLPGATAARKLIVQRAQEYLDSLAREARSDPSVLRELATAYIRLGNVQGNPQDANAGETGGALQSYRKAVALQESALALRPSDRDVRRELAEDYLALGLGLWATGDQAGFDTDVAHAVRMLEPLADSNPGDQRIQRALGKAYERRAGSYLVGKSKDLARAKREYEKSLGVYAKLQQLDPKSTQYPRDVSFAHKHVGSMLIEQHQLQDALDHYQAALAIDEARFQADPHSVQTRFDITYTYSDIGFIVGKLGDLEAALARYRQALQIRSELAAADPQDSRTREAVARTYTYIGGLLKQQKDYPNALAAYQHALATYQDLSTRDPVNGRLRFSIADVEAWIGNLYVDEAFAAGVSPQTRDARCQQAELWLRRALPTYMARRAQGKLAFDAEDPTRLEASMARCASRQ